MPSVWTEQPTWRRCWAQESATGTGANPEDLILVRNPLATERSWVAWFCIFVFIPALFAVVGIAIVFSDLAWEATLFMILCFGLLGLLLLIGVVGSIFSRERLRLDSRSLEYHWFNGLVQKRRVIPLAEIRSITPYSVMVANCDSQRSSHPEFGLEIETLGLPLRLGQTRDLDEADRLEETIEQHLRDWAPDWINAPGCPDRVILDASRVLPEPPSDSTIRCRREWDQTVFTRDVPATWCLLLALVPAVLIGIATFGVVRRQPFERLDANVLLCAIPAGLAILLLVLPWASLIMHRRRWIVRAGEVTSLHPLLGRIRMRTTDIEWLDRIELRWKWPSSWRSLGDRLAFGPFAPGYELALVDLDGHVAASLGPLTEGEARWMAGILAEVLKDALPKGGQTVARWSVTVDPPVSGSPAMADPYLDEPALGVGLPDRQK